MLNIIDIFRKLVPKKRIPIVGEQWVHIVDGPWEPIDPDIVTITGVSQGFVRYDREHSSDFRREISFFLDYFKPYEKDEKTLVNK